MLQNVKGEGQKDNIVDISDGYALNSLIPQKKAIQATREQLAALNQKNNAKEQASHAENEALDNAINNIAGTTIVYTCKANEKGSLFKKITLLDIAHILEEKMQIKLPPSMIECQDAPIKQVGEFHVLLVKTGGKKQGLLHNKAQ